jgi:hypothetical protein
MKKKKKKGLLDYKFKFIVSEEMNRRKGTYPPSPKVAMANEHLKNIKLPE